MMFWLGVSAGGFVVGMAWWISNRGIFGVCRDIGSAGRWMAAKVKG